MNRGVLILQRELKTLTRMGDLATNENYDSEKVERKVIACCKLHNQCRYAAQCVSLWDTWSERAPIKYSPAELDRLLASMPSLEWIPKLYVGTHILGTPNRERFPYWECTVEIPDWKEASKKRWQERLSAQAERREL